MDKIEKSGKVIFVILCSFLFMFLVSACSGNPQKQPDIVVFDRTLQTQEDERCGTDADSAVVLYGEICAEIMEAGTMNRLDMVRTAVDRLGENGYVAVDSENQVDMTNAGQVLEFCRAVDAGERAGLTIMEVISSERIYAENAGGNAVNKAAAMLCGFRKYDFHTQDGKVDIVRTYYGFGQNGTLVGGDTVEYPADLWQYTEDGYLVFAGNYFAEDYYIISLTDEPEYAAFRVEPLDAQCRDLCRRYIWPVGYADNNLFLVNWTEQDIAGLDINDLFDRFYPMVYQKSVPYTASENPGVGFVYRIAEGEFEGVVRSCLNVTPGQLRSETVYFADDQSYEYKPRGFYEAGCSNMPYPEVVAYSENADGIITLTVNAVFPYEGTSRAFAHEVVVRPLENGGFQYVSNQIKGGEYDAWWYTRRLTAQEWQEVYGGHQSGETKEDELLWYLPRTDECLLTETETEALSKTALAAAGQAKKVYQNMEIGAGASYASNVIGFNQSQCREVVSILGKAGFVSVAEDVNMQNYEEVEDFYVAYKQRQDAMVTVYKVQEDGLIGALTFVYRNTGQGDKIQAYYIGIGWEEGGTPRIKNTLLSDIARMYMTEKGYLIYSYEEQIVHSDENQYLRVRPLPDACRELTQKYVEGLSFVNYNAFVTDWDSGSVENILVPCMFEDIYHIAEGVTLKAENDRIPAAVYERIMTTYFPVSAGQLRSKCGYDADSGSYPYEMIFAIPHAPFGEVVDYRINPAGTKNADETITLFVDGVWIDYDSDCAFKSEIVVQPFADGTFRYLSNTVTFATDAFSKAYMNTCE